MSTKFLRENLVLSFAMATSLCIGILLYRLVHPTDTLLPLAPPNQNIDLVGRAAPEISLTTLAQEPFVLSQWRGHTVLINFWGTWCPPCLKEIPLLIDFQRKGESGGLRVVGVAIDEPEALRIFAERLGFNFPIVWTTFHLMEQFGNGVGTLPYSVLIDSEGIILEQHFRPLEEADLARILSERLGLASAPPTTPNGIDDEPARP